MRYLALASDYDGTLARHGTVAEETLEALARFRHSGRKLVLVTGRELTDLESVFPRLDLFDRVVAENGAVLYEPETHEKKILAAAPAASFVNALKARGVQPIGVGDVIVSTWHPNETIVLDVIRDLGLELHVIFNKGAVMVLPPGINKMYGLCAALNDLGLSEHNVVGTGDAENDHAVLSYCECSVAVANALPAVKSTADLVTERSHGAGVVELIDMILKDDLALENAKPWRRAIPVGREGGHEISIRAYGSSVLVAGASGGGKSTLVAGLLESLVERKYQVCLIDPEGDYEAWPDAITVGDEKHAPSVDQIVQALKKPGSQVVANLIGMAVPDRPDFFMSLLPRLQEMRMRTGRPHWLVIDEAHPLLPCGWAPASAALAGELNNLILITVHPDHVAPPALRAVDVVFAVGPSAEKVMKGFAEATGIRLPETGSKDLPSGEALVWFHDSQDFRHVEFAPSSTERQRHKRKYALGELGQDRSFFFRGSRGQLNLRAQNLMVFLQLAEGVDDETWLHHLKRGDYSKWFREGIKDEALAQEVAQIEKTGALDPRSSREKVKRAIEERYTAPA